jgi:hypothetical protein
MSKRADGVRGTSASERCRLLDELIDAWIARGSEPELTQRRINARAAIEAAWSAPGVPVGSCTYPDCACAPNGDVGCNSPNAAARGVAAVEATSTMPSDLAQRIAVALECGVLWTEGAEAHPRMQAALADFNAWRTAGVPATEQRNADSMGKLISALEFVIRHSDSLTPSDIQRMQAILAEVTGGEVQRG